MTKLRTVPDEQPSLDVLLNAFRISMAASVEAAANVVVWFARERAPVAPPIADELLTAQEAAVLLNVHASVLLELVKTDRLPMIEIPGPGSSSIVRFSRRDLTQFVASL